MKGYKKYGAYGILSLLFAYVVCTHEVSAHVPVLVTQETLDDIVLIEDPELSQVFYGTMQGFPHTFEIRASEPFTLFTQILLPDIDSSTNNISGIIVRELKSGRVEDVAPLNAKDASWETMFEPFGGDTYRKGPEFETTLDPGVYRIEVHTPDNLEKYILAVGKREEMSISYFELIRRFAQVKMFFEKSQFRVIESPFVYVPLLLSALIGFGVWKWRRRNRVY